MVDGGARRLRIAAGLGQDEPALDRRLDVQREAVGIELRPPRLPQRRRQVGNEPPGVAEDPRLAGRPDRGELA